MGLALYSLCLSPFLQQARNRNNNKNRGERRLSGRKGAEPLSCRTLWQDDYEARLFYGTCAHGQRNFRDSRERGRGHSNVLLGGWQTVRHEPLIQWFWLPSP
jgi:hypothetical protein